MTVSPVIGWESCHCDGVYSWSSGGTIVPGMAPSGSVAITTTDPLVTFNIGTLGTVAFAITGTVTEGSNTISSLSSTADLAVGQAISGAGIPSYSWIASINTGASSLVFRNGYMDVTTNDQAATASGTGVALVISDPYPIGTLLASVSPSTGVTITDNNFDGTGNVNYLGNGSAVCNLAGQGEGNFSTAFADTGTFIVECMYVTADPNYASVTVSPAITIVVT